MAGILINAAEKEDSQMIIDHMEIKKYKIFEQDKHSHMLFNQHINVMICLILLKLFNNLIKQFNHM